MNPELAQALEDSQVIIDKGNQFIDEMNESYRAVYEKLMMLPLKLDSFVNYYERYHPEDPTEMWGGKRLAFMVDTSSQKDNNWTILFSVFNIKCSGSDDSEGGMLFEDDTVQEWPWTVAPLKERLEAYPHLLTLFQQVMQQYEYAIQQE